MVRNDNDVKVSVSFNDFPLKHFKRFKDEAVDRTGHPGIYWKTVVDLMDEVDSLRKLVRVYESVFMIDEREEETVVEEPAPPVSLGGHSE